MAMLVRVSFVLFLMVLTASAFAQVQPQSPPQLVGQAPAGLLDAYYVNQAIQPYIASLKSFPTDDFDSLAPDQQQMCQKRYDSILKNGVIQIKIAMGYFDWSLADPAPIVIGSTNYGWSPSIDPGVSSVFQSLMTASCEGSLQFCGFKQDPSDRTYFNKYVTIRGQRYLARVQIRNASISEYLMTNTQTRRDEQSVQSAAMEQFFADSFKDSNVLIYYGHSRNGGGPDFNPPRILPNGHLDYANYYKAVRPGFKMMAADLKASKTPPAIFGLMSCDSRDHFFDSVRQLAPSMGVVSSTAILTLNETFTATVGTIDSVLRGQCQKSFYEEIRMNTLNQQYITMDGVFN